MPVMRLRAYQFFTAGVVVAFSAAFILMNHHDVCKISHEPIISGWEIPIDKGFCEIQNEKSVQLDNADDHETVYLSTITVEREDGKPIDSNLENDLNKIGQPKLREEAGLFHLEGTKTKGDQVLIVVITFKNKSDEQWARDYFSRMK
jgi:hypothetical protein